MVSFSATQRQSPVVLFLNGEVTVTSLVESLLPIEAELKRGKRALLVDLRRASPFHGDARDHLVRWSKQRSDVISAMAIVSEKTSLRMMVKAVSLFGGKPMKAFVEPIAATAWLNRLG